MNLEKNNSALNYRIVLRDETGKQKSQSIPLYEENLNLKELAEKLREFLKEIKQ